MTIHESIDRALAERKERRRAQRIVIVRTPSGFVREVDPVTRCALEASQQFAVSADGQTITPITTNVANPEILDVGWVQFG